MWPFSIKLFIKIIKNCFEKRQNSKQQNNKRPKLITNQMINYAPFGLNSSMDSNIKNDNWF